MFTKSYEKIHEKQAIVINGLGEYDLSDTFECGQCFRYEEVLNDSNTGYKEYIIVVKKLLVSVGQRKRGELIFYELSDKDFEETVKPFFALETDLDEIRRDITERTSSDWLKDAAILASGISILKQDPFEALISFIISQNNNIPRIRKIIRQICAEYGVNLCLHDDKMQKCPLSKCNGSPCEEICKSCGVCYTFPTAEDIVNCPHKILTSRPGFRYDYICDAAKKVLSGEINLDMIGAARSYHYTLENLKRIRGVGDKIASCVALFAFANLDAFPIDVWIKRAIDTYFDGELDPLSLGRYAGVAQQYIFHKIRNIENDKKN